ACEQRFRGTAQDRGELPTEVVGVLHTGIEALPAGRWVDVSRIACQEHAPYAKVIRQTCVHVVARNPGYRADQDVVAAGASANHGGQRLGGEVDLTLRGDDGLQLEEVGSSERAQGYLLGCSVVEAVPSIPTQPLHEDIRDNGSDIQTSAREANVKHAAHQA